VGTANGLIAGGMAAVACATCYVAWKAGRTSEYRRLVPGAVVTIFGILVLIAFYRWSFQTGTCNGRGDVVCVTNQNQGILTLLALLLAALAVWVEVLSRHSNELREKRERSRHANQAVGDAIEECHHNLLHAALCYTNREMTHLPWGLSIEDICALAEREYRHEVDEHLLGHIDRIRRTYESVQELRNRFMNANSDKEREAARAALLAEPHQFQGLVVHHLGFLRDAWRAYRLIPGCRERMEQPGLQDLPRVVEAHKKRNLYGYFRTSDEDAQKEAATIRTEEAVVACWFDDGPIGVQTFAFGPRFEDAAEAHVH
jgi:hypothetical protein